MKEKGFTLIELLAVIVILAVIALISVPLVMNYIDDAKEGSFTVTGRYLIEVAETQYAKALLDNPNVIPTITFADLEYKGEQITDGKLAFDEEGTASLAIYKDNKCVYKNAGDNDVTLDTSLTKEECLGKVVEETPVLTTYVDGTPVYYNPTTGTKCEEASAISTTGTKSGCMKWYTFGDQEGNTEVKLLLDHNTTAGIAWNSSRSNTSMNEVQTQLTSDTAGWHSNMTPRLITADEIATITGNTSFKGSSTGTSGFFYFDTNTRSASTTCKSGNTSGCNYGWLYDRTDTSCTTYGCLNNADSSMTGSGYWTSTATAGSSYYVWRVTYDGSLYINYANYVGGGVRPVISVSKSILK